MEAFVLRSIWAKGSFPDKEMSQGWNIDFRIWKSDNTSQGHDFFLKGFKTPQNNATLKAVLADDGQEVTQPLFFPPDSYWFTWM